MKEYTVNVGGMQLTVLLDEDEAKARGAKPVQAPEPAADPEPKADSKTVTTPDTKALAPANKARTGQAKA